MGTIDIHRPEDLDLSAPLQIADRIWWVGHALADDPFQCHVYLIENGKQSVLFDPGGRLTFRHTLEKIEKVIPFSYIRYFVCHHQDPDITGALPIIDEMISRPDALLITHWRAAVLIKHYDLEITFWNVEENNWRLDLEGRQLQFIFTPYAHFPGAFCTFDSTSGVLFSSDLFGGFSDNFELIARDESCFESIRPFHEHYIPSTEILKFTLNRLRRYPLELIAPQHGSLIPKKLIKSIFRQLESIKCGLYLLAEKHTDIHRLSELSTALRDITQAMVLNRDFCNIANRMLEIAEPFLPVRTIAYYINSDEGVLLLTEENSYRSEIVEPSMQIADILNANRSLWQEKEEQIYLLAQEPNSLTCKKDHSLILPIFSRDSDRVKAVAIFCLEHLNFNFEDAKALISQMSTLLQVTVEREALYRSLDLQREKLYHQAVRDQLTGLFTRYYMNDAAQRLFAIHDRETKSQVGIIMIDIDHFKTINDSYGHLEGDRVLQTIGTLILDQVRQSDMAVRLGGEEFIVFLPNMDAAGCAAFAERLRTSVAALKFDGELAGRQVTASFGVAIRQKGEILTDLVGRADAMLYKAKENGRNQVQSDNK